MHKTLKMAAAVASAIALTLSAVALPAFAQVNLGASAGLTANISATGTGAGISAGASLKAGIITTAQNRADAEITRRITALNALNTRVGEMQKLSSTEQSSLQSSIQSQITLMNNLQAQIAADAQAQSTSSLKTDIQSITKSYRIFILIIPQGEIEAASDRVLTIASDMTTLSGQLSARISAAATSTNVTAAQASLTDMNAKIADAQTQANAANSEVVSLQPDNGVTSVEQSNTAALKDARSKIQAGQQDFVTARQDALAIMKDLKITVTASVSATTTAQ